MVEREQLVAKGLGEVVQTRKRGEGKTDLNHHSRSHTRVSVWGQEAVFPTIATTNSDRGEGDASPGPWDRHQGCYGLPPLLLQWLCAAAAWRWTNWQSAELFGNRVSNPFLVLKNSALSGKVKRDSLVQQAVTRLCNTRRTLPWKVSANILTEFSLKMKWSGCNSICQGEVIRAAVQWWVMTWCWRRWMGARGPSIAPRI